MKKARSQEPTLTQWLGRMLLGWGLIALEFILAHATLYACGDFVRQTTAALYLLALVALLLWIAVGLTFALLVFDVRRHRWLLGAGCAMLLITGVAAVSAKMEERRFRKLPPQPHFHEPP